MARRQAAPKPEELVSKLDEKVSAIKEEIEGIIEELKNDVDVKSNQIEENRKSQEQGFEDLHEALGKLKEQFKQDVENNREETEILQKELKEEILAKLEKTSEDIEHVEGKMSQNITDVSENISAAEDRNTASVAELTLSIESLEVKVEKKLESKVELLLSKLEGAVKTMEQSKGNQDTDMTSFKEELTAVMERVDEINEKMYDFEANKRNNLIFYGIPNESRESHSILHQKVNQIIKTSLGLRREIPVTKTSRMHSGPEVGGCRPVLVTFEDFKDREDVLRKGGMLRGSSVSITEDMSRRVRESRTELRKFMRDLKKNNPAATCHLQYDKLFVNHRCYVWNEGQGKVVEFSQGDESRPSSRSSSPVKTRRYASALSRSQSMKNINGEEDEKDKKIKELEETLQKQKELMEILQQKLCDTPANEDLVD